MACLDLYSTSATSTCAPSKCTFNAPYLAYPKDVPNSGRRWYLVQGCCNHWTCPRCGVIRAKQEYWTIVNGVNKLTEDGHTLWFMTFTCRGRDLSAGDALEGYMRWTKRVNDAMRVKAKRAGEHFAYVAVTEKQKRGHPHSHMLVTWCPPDTGEYSALKYAYRDGRKKLVRKDAEGRTRHHSEWLKDQAVRAGLGEQVDITAVRDSNAVSRYVAKYLFKDAMTLEFPTNWKRIRYSQNFPRQEKMSNPDAFPVLSTDDWKRVRKLGQVTVVGDIMLAKRALMRDVAVYFQSNPDASGY